MCFATVLLHKGNQNADVAWRLPGGCPDTMAATAVDKWDTPTYFTNYARPNPATWMLGKLIAAPGMDITSTYPLDLGYGLYATVSGTSQAAAFVSGAGVLCVLSKACQVSKIADEVPASKVNFPVLISTAKQQPCGQWAVSGGCGPDWGDLNGYYGYMTNVSSFRQW